jgi:hypothetical protein
MQTRVRILVVAALVLGFQGAARAADKQPVPSKPFPVAKVRFEQNATDGDVEVVFEIVSDDDGLTELAIISPNGRRVVDFKAPDTSTLGMREFEFESPEPKNVESLKAAYPPGKYTFLGTTTAGAKLQCTARLSYDLPATVSFLTPAKNAQGVDSQTLEITWTPVENAARYVVELEQPKLHVKLSSRQPASIAKFAVPNGLLVPGTKYHLGIGVESAAGNISFVETSFTTAGSL